MTEELYIKQIEEQNKKIENYEMQIEILKQKLDYYKKIAFTDSLTKLCNRRSIEKSIDYDIVILGDLDHFKYINDNYGHKKGDLVLIEVSNILKKYVRESDLACRWGGEEFVILLKNCDYEDAYNKVVNLKNEISKLSEKFGFKITMSFGISNIYGKTLQQAINEADIAMYESKENGRNKISIYELKK